MGNLFFMLRMGVYTVFLIMILQVKVGSTTLEEKLYQLTRQSELAGQVQGVAQGIIGFAINQYRGLTGQTSEPLRLPDEVNSERLRVRLKDLKNSINRKWETVEEIKTQEPGSRGDENHKTWKPRR